MKTLIICFSQTGNTRKIADCIFQGILDAGSQCEIKTLNDTDPVLVFFLNGLLFSDYIEQVDKFPDYFDRRYFRLA
jgi:flavodoxin